MPPYLAEEVVPKTQAIGQRSRVSLGFLPSLLHQNKLADSPSRTEPGLRWTKAVRVPPVLTLVPLQPSLLCNLLQSHHSWNHSLSCLSSLLLSAPPVGPVIVVSQRRLWGLGLG